MPRSPTKARCRSRTPSSRSRSRRAHSRLQYPNTPLPFIGAADRTSFYQLKTILQGVVARGTARAISQLSPYVAGKTGTTEDAVDGWFVGFTNDVTIAVWVGYDNGDGKRRSLGTSATGQEWRCRSSSPSLRLLGRRDRPKGAAQRAVAGSKAASR